MTLGSLLAFAAAGSAVVLACLALAKKRDSASAWCFLAGMLVLAVESLLAALGMRITEPAQVSRWVTLGLIASACVPAPWLLFSLTYCWGRVRPFPWTIPLSVAALLPVAMMICVQQGVVDVAALGTGGGHPELRFGPAATAVNALLLVMLVLALMNLERTFRSAVGAMRWRIKFVIVGVAVILGAHAYVRSEAILFSAHDVALSAVEPTALLVGCLCLALAYARTGFREIDVHPSRAVLRSSVTLLIAGAYLFIVGVLAQLAGRFGGAESFQVQSLVVLLGMAGLAVLLMSDHVRQQTHAFVRRHFGKAQHDSVRVWGEFSRRLTHVKDEGELCTAAAALISETFQVLSVTVWLVDDATGELRMAASTTGRSDRPASVSTTPVAPRSVAAGLQASLAPFDLEQAGEPWADEMRRLNASVFPNGGARWCVPLRAENGSLGAFVLADRVNAAEYSGEDLELLRCIAAQATSALLNLRLADEVARAKGMDAFRTMSAFFVHDLKNAAASLGLTLRNLPVHFDDPGFREDALRTIGNTASRIDAMIARLTALRQHPDLNRVDVDVNEIARRALNRLNGRLDGAEVTERLAPVPLVSADPEQIQSVVTNVLLNAREALQPGGHLRIATEHNAKHVVLSVTDDGCGMTPAFLRDSLFRPFQSTKTNGLGIGMYQCKAIVEAHGGRIEVESLEGTGTTVRLHLPTGRAT